MRANVELELGLLPLIEQPDKAAILLVRKDNRRHRIRLAVAISAGALHVKGAVVAAARNDHRERLLFCEKWNQRTEKRAAL